VSAEPSRILVVLPNWVGDVVMATPALRALRRRFDEAQITFLARPYVADLVAGSGWMDEMVFWPAHKPNAVSDEGLFRLAQQLRARRFNLAVLLANSFRSALLACLAGARRRVGYDRDGRGLLLTDRLVAHRLNGKFIPVSMVRYYSGIADYLGCRELSARLELPARPVEDRRIEQICRQGGIGQDEALVVINPGAAFGLAKCWPPQRFAELADRLVEASGARVVITCGPRERSVGQAIQAAIRRDAVVLAEPPLSLGELMGLVRRCDLVITNDSGPRHFAAAYEVPVVTIFGPTDPRWSETGYGLERKVSVCVDCAPCMRRICPLDHRCMTWIDVAMVLQPALELLRGRSARQTATGPCQDEHVNRQPEQSPVP
jgi:heptosyltransferase-2